MAELIREQGQKGLVGGPGSLVVVAFPSGQFGGQELATNAEIKAFVERSGLPCGGEDGGFLLMDKVDVNGPGASDVFTFLKAASSAAEDVKWNFGAYWLVGKGGAVERLPGLKQGPKEHAGRVQEALDA
uniref:Glutathione peroxidase n=1 Tax=Zooxanthella nutricula TaxID=1333877 RepID=A0A6V0EE78_9DINO|mmetsp:Transcript_15060/g.44638  ORF Transcript_15060/g.44638 Transcript_15060/m.44638 type:complete len:129 (+) Transcript_15060:322-708(+)